MNTPARASLIATISLGCFALASCASAGDSREAAGVGSWPACAAGFATECVVTVPERSTVTVNNGTTVIFAEQGKPVEGLATIRICWSDEDDVDATTCADSGDPLPEWLVVEPTTVQASGTTWPALSIRILQATDALGETFVPLPALMDVAVEGVSAGSTVSIEVACCDVVEPPQAESLAPTAPEPPQAEGVSAWGFDISPFFSG